MLVLSASLTQLYFPSVIDFVKRFDQGTNGTICSICSIGPLLILDMLVMQNYAHISNKNNNRGCFLKTTTGRLEIFMKRHTDSDKNPKRVEFPHDEENDFEISYMRRSTKIKNRFIFPDLVEEASSFHI